MGIMDNRDGRGENGRLNAEMAESDRPTGVGLKEDDTRK